MMSFCGKMCALLALVLVACAGEPMGPDVQHGADRSPTDREEVAMERHIQEALNRTAASLLDSGEKDLLDDLVDEGHTALEAPLSAAPGTPQRGGCKTCSASCRRGECTAHCCDGRKAYCRCTGWLGRPKCRCR